MDSSSESFDPAYVLDMSTANATFCFLTIRRRRCVPAVILTSADLFVLYMKFILPRILSAHFSVSWLCGSLEKKTPGVKLGSFSSSHQNIKLKLQTYWKFIFSWIQIYFCIEGVHLGTLMALSVQWLWFGRPRDRGSIPGSGRRFCLLQNVQTDSGAHPHSHWLFPGGRTAEAWK